jgi:hypothetical protein
VFLELFFYFGGYCEWEYSFASSKLDIDEFWRY